VVVSWGKRQLGAPRGRRRRADDLKVNHGRIDVDLEMWGHPERGVLLIYSKWGGGFRETYSSKGDLMRLREFVRSLHGTPLPIGLFYSVRSYLARGEGVYGNEREASDQHRLDF